MMFQSTTLCTVLTIVFQVVSTTTDNDANFVKAFREFRKDSETDDNDTDVASNAVE